MNLAVLLPLVLLAAPAAGAKEEGETIVVTATSLPDTEKALRACLARHCPPNEDIDASLAHAENLFVAGRYKEARSTTLAAIGRNRKFADRFPVDVSDLYRANGRISAHLGEGDDYRWSTTAIRRSLKQGLPEDDPRLVGADIEAAAMYAALGRLDRARQLYRRAEGKAKDIGRPDLAAAARVRAAWLHQIQGDPDTARRELKAMAADMSPAATVPRLTALILLARIDRLQGKAESSDALIAELRKVKAAQPILLFAPPIRIPGQVPADGPAMAGMRRELMDNVEDVWVDVGFWVTPEGRVDDVEILRSHGSTRWAQPVLGSIEGRIYSPSSGSGRYRIERYSYTALWTKQVTGTHMRQREPDTRIEFLDLTNSDPPARGGGGAKKP